MKIDPGVNIPWDSKYYMTPVFQKLRFIWWFPW
jgi:hypothetical protein